MLTMITAPTAYRSRCLLLPLPNALAAYRSHCPPLPLPGAPAANRLRCLPLLLPISPYQHEDGEDHGHDHSKPQLGEVARLDTCVTLIDSGDFYNNLGR